VSARVAHRAAVQIEHPVEVRRRAVVRQPADPFAAASSSRKSATVPADDTSTTARRDRRTSPEPAAGPPAARDVPARAAAAAKRARDPDLDDAPSGGPFTVPCAERPEQSDRPHVVRPTRPTDPSPRPPGSA
jgi:hypothetical protein